MTDRLSKLYQPFKCLFNYSFSTTPQYWSAYILLKTSCSDVMKQKCKTDQSLYISTIRASDIELPQHFPAPVGEIISPTVWLTLIVGNYPCGLGNKGEKHCTSLSLSRLPRLLSRATLLWYPSNRHKEAGPPQGAGSSLLRRPGF